MTLYLYLQIKPLQRILFTSPLAGWLKNEAPEVIVFEADNHSDDFLMNKGKAFIDQADHLVLHLDLIGTEPPGSLSMLLEHIRKSKKTVRCFVEGEHQLLHKMLSLMHIEPLRIDSVDMIKSQINI